MARGIIKLEALIEETPLTIKEDGLMVLLNQDPHEKWVKIHPLDSSVKYLPIERVEYLLNRIYGGFNVEVKTQPVILVNSVQVTVRVHVVNPITGEKEFQDGVAAWPIQMDAGANPTDITKIKPNGVQLAVASAKSDAIKDAAHHFGRIFGRDLNRKDKSDYDSILKPVTTEEELKKLYQEKKHLFTEQERTHIERIIDKKEVTSYDKLMNTLKVTVLNMNNPQKP